MNTDNYNMAIDKLVFYRLMCVEYAERGTTDYSAYICKLSAGSDILAIASGKDSYEVYLDVREAYDSKCRG